MTFAGGTVANVTGNASGNGYITFFGGQGGNGECGYFSIIGSQPNLTITFNQPVSNVSLSIGIVTFGFDGQYLTVSDNLGHSQLVDMNAYRTFFPGQTVFFPYGDIQQIAITDPYALPNTINPDWGYFIGSLTYAPSNPIQLLDPVPDLVNGKSINTDTFTALATLGRPVSGIAADGVARLVVRVAAAAAGEGLTLSLLNDVGSVSSNPAVDGQLADIYGNVYGGQMQLTAVSTSQGPMAFAVYVPPSDFSRGTTSDDNAVTRGVSLSVNPVSNPSATSTMGLTIWRPPVVLVHGLWSSSQAWNAFGGVTGDPRFFIRMSDYSQPVGIASSVPSYSAKTLSRVIASGLGFAYNTTKVTIDIDKAVSEFRLVNNAAAAQADIVAHSMGGDITRTLIQSARYPSLASFGAGTVHKLVTIGTPHLGSPVALAMLSPSNSCVAGLLASNTTNIPIGEATLATGASVTGAVGDLQGSGFVGGFLSPALQQIQTNTGVEVPTAPIAGVTSAANLSGLNSARNALLISAICGNLAQNPLALDLNASGWNSVFGQSNDGMVPLSSELNGMPGSPFTGVVHSPGVEALGFLGPSELDYQPIQTQVITLLNAPVGSSSFVLIP